MRKSRAFWIVCSGMLWFAVGVFLLMFGVKFIVFSSVEGAPNTILFSKLAKMVKNREQSALILVAIGLILGFIKGRFVLSKTVNRIVGRLRALPEPIKFSDVYSVGYLLLIAAMVLLGMSLKWFSCPPDLRGTVDIAVGSALMNGAVHYFRTILKKAPQ